MEHHPVVGVCMAPVVSEMMMLLMPWQLFARICWLEPSVENEDGGEQG